VNALAVGKSEVTAKMDVQPRRFRTRSKVKRCRLQSTAALNGGGGSATGCRRPTMAMMVR
jgi:hypothetical protein